MDIKQYFKTAIIKNGSDLHLVEGEIPMVRVNGELEKIGDQVIAPNGLRDSLNQFLSKDQMDSFATEKDLDFGYVLDDHRFRVNLHQQSETIGLAARLIPSEIPTPDDLFFEPVLRAIPKMLDGLVLVTGVTGSGKSTTIASIIEEINKNRKAHIVTIEDPIEFVFKDKQSLIEQREVGVDTKTFASALKHVLRQDPNVILIGEMRDPETISTALTAAETGHLVLSTLHTGSVAEAVERIVDVFEGSKQKQVLLQLSSVLRVVVAQQLLPSPKLGRVAAREILINNSGVSNLIKEGNTNQIKSAVQTGVKDGMITMENSVEGLLSQDLITKETAQNRTGKNKTV